MPATEPSPSDSLSYDGALRRLLGLADYERMAGLAPSMPKDGLDRMRELASRMGNPQNFVPAIHIAGTKGKGSVAAMVTSMLCAAGLRAVTFTSPHLHTFRERIRLNGESSTEAQFAEAVERAWPHVTAMASESPHGRPSVFEVLTVMAFDVARVEQADVQVLEVGLGGRLDSTNVVNAAVAVITSISLDHMAVLGDTLEAIAAEKAGIIKSSAPVVVAPQRPEAMAVVEAAARAHGAPLVRVGREVRFEGSTGGFDGQPVTVTTPRHTYGLSLPLLGRHQQENAAAAVAAVEACGLSVPPEAVVAGIREVRWDGRFQVLSTSPCVIADGAHNVDSMQRLRETVREYLPGKRVIAVFGCSADKNTQGMVEEVAGLAGEVIVSASHHPRAVRPEVLRVAFEREGKPCQIMPDVAAALRLAETRAGKEGAVIATGSLFLVAEVLEAWHGVEGERYPEFEPRSTVAFRGAP